jgi:cell pole-organizing protein PopZ
MAQSNALREQPSMDEILASIRRIIDAGETGKKAHADESVIADAPEGAPEPLVEVTVPPRPANDAGSRQKPVPQSTLEHQPKTPLIDSPPAENTRSVDDLDIVSAVADYMNNESSARVVDAEPAGDAGLASDTQAVFAPVQPEADFPDPDISEVEAALEAEFTATDKDILVAERQAKYGARFTEADGGAFREVANALRDRLDDASERNLPQHKGTVTLTSDNVSRAVTQSFSELSGQVAQTQQDLDEMAEEMLRPMLQEWLDNNLPSMVERLVRAEIERIARGDPRNA